MAKIKQFFPLFSSGLKIIGKGENGAEWALDEKINISCQSGTLMFS
jgi:hypothetical protein